MTDVIDDYMQNVLADFQQIQLNENQISNQTDNNGVDQNSNNKLKEENCNEQIDNQGSDDDENEQMISKIENLKKMVFSIENDHQTNKSLIDKFNRQILTHKNFLEYCQFCAELLLNEVINEDEIDFINNIFLKQIEKEDLPIIYNTDPLHLFINYKDHFSTIENCFYTNTALTTEKIVFYYNDEQSFTISKQQSQTVFGKDTLYSPLSRKLLKQLYKNYRGNTELKYVVRTGQSYIRYWMNKKMNNSIRKSLLTIYNNPKITKEDQVFYINPFTVKLRKDFLYPYDINYIAIAVLVNNWDRYYQQQNDKKYNY
jgi:hypothetical protein